MDTTALIQNIHFLQKLILILFLLALSIYFQISKKSFHKTHKTSEDKSKEESLMGDFFEKLINIGSIIYLILFPLMLVFLEYTVSFYIFVGLLLGFYTAFFIVFTIITLYKNGSKFWTWLEDKLL
jgi:hypothetical protein